MKKSLSIAQAQSQLAVIILAQAQLKEYEANWLTNAKTVTRDTSGRFASVGQTVRKTIEDPTETKRKISSELLKATAKGLDKLVSRYPQFTNTLLDKMLGMDAEKARDRLADVYGSVNPGLPNAIKPNPLMEIKADIKRKNHKQLAKDLAQAFELAGYKYNKLLDDLNNVESESEAVKLLGKIAATSIPIAAYLAATLTPEVAIGMLVGDTLGSILASAAATQAVSFAANKAMDKADVKNPFFRLGIDLAIGIGVGGAVSAGAKQLEKRAVLKASQAKQAQEIAEAEAEAAKKIKARKDRIDNIKDKNAKDTLLIAQSYISKQDEESYKSFISMGIESELIDSVISNVDSIVSKARIAVRIPDLNIFDLIKNSRFKSTFETSYRNNHGYMDLRNKVEETAFGITEQTTEAASRPIYGYLVDGKDIVSGTYKSEGKATVSYGTISIILKENVNTTASFTGTDSFQKASASLMEKPGLGAFFINGFRNPKVIRESFEELKNAKTIEDLVNCGANATIDKKPRYLEAQVFGQINGSDIAEIVLNDTNYSLGANPDLAKSIFGTKSAAGYIEEIEKEGIKVHVPHKPLEEPDLKSLSEIDDAHFDGRMGKIMRQTVKYEKDPEAKKRSLETLFTTLRKDVIEKISKQLNVFRYLEAADNSTMSVESNNQRFKLIQEFEKDVIDAVKKHDPNFFSEFEASWGLPIYLGL